MSQKPSGLKSPTKIGKPSGLPRSGLPTPSSSRAQIAIEKSARAAGLSTPIAHQYAQDIVTKLPSPEPEGIAELCDDFIIGDRCYVGGTKPGHIAFIGETRFAPGEWAGVVLDQPVGKNDGSVAGVRYFQCAAKHGVFSRISKLTRDFTKPDHSAMPPPQSASVPAVKTSTKQPSISRTVKPPSTGLSASRSISGSTASISSNKPSPTGSTASLAQSVTSLGVLRLGDRVLVSGTKAGVIRYLGTTDFAKGDWAGVELDEAQGKNDGAVAGKRYFQCKPLYGLFAPVGKVVKATNAVPSTPTGSTKAVAPRRIGVTPVRTSMGLKRAGSQESVSSIGSNTSSVSRSRAPRTNAKPVTTNLSSTTLALQKALKEKDEHIEQLLKEREMERAEVARAASQCDEAENMLLSVRNEHQVYIDESEQAGIRLQNQVEELVQERNSLLSSLEEEKRKVEDLQFTIEEDAIQKDDLEEDSEKYNEELKKVKTLLEEERGRVAKLEQDVQRWKGLHGEVKERHKDAEDSSVAYLEKIEELTHLLNTAQDQLIKGKEQESDQRGSVTEIKGQLEMSQAEVAGVKGQLEKSQGEVAEVKGRLEEALTEVSSLKSRLEESEERAGSVTETEKQVSDLKAELESVNKSLHHTKAQLAVLEAELQGNKQLKDEAEERLEKMSEVKSEGDLKIEQQQRQITDLESRLTKSDSMTEELQVELQGVKSQLTELQAQLGISEDRGNHLEEEKQKLENQIKELMDNSGNSSEQLNILNDKLQDNEQRVAALQADLSASTQRVAKLQAESREQSLNHEREMESMSKEQAKKDMENQQLVQSMQLNIEQLKAKSAKTKENLERECEECVKKKEEQMKGLRERLESEEASRASLNSDLEGVQAEVSQMKKERGEREKERGKLEESLEKREKEKEELRSELESLKQSQQSSSASLSQKLAHIESEKSKLQSDWTTERDSLANQNTELSKQVATLTESTEGLTKKLSDREAECKDYSEKLSSLTEQHQQEEGKTIEALRNQLKEMEANNLSLEKEITTEKSKRQEKELESEKLSTDLIKLKTLENTCRQYEKENNDLREKYEEVQSRGQELTGLQEEYNLISSEKLKLQKELEKSKEDQCRLADEYDMDKATMEHNLERTQAMVESQQQEIEELRLKLQDSEQHQLRDDTELEDIKNQLESVQYDKDELEMQVGDLEMQIESLKNRNPVDAKDVVNNSGGAPTANNATLGVDSVELDSLRTDYEAALGKIDFLNSVICGLHEKNESLKKTVDILTDKVTHHGDDGDDDLMDSRFSPSSRPAAPRLFCDICDCFDLHDTEDCPQQQSSDNEITNSKHNGDRLATRPYCEICEEFDHDTEDCDDQQTF